jgi:hypothetical protein
MNTVMALIVLGMLAPVFLYIWYVAIHVPRRGRKMQEERWLPLASKLGGTLKRNGRFSSIAVPFGATVVQAFVADRALIDAAIKSHEVEFGGWRTFVHAPVAGATASFSSQTSARGDQVFQLARHKITPELGTPPELIARRLTPDLRNALDALGDNYRYVIAGPNLVAIELPGVCDRPELLEAAIYVAGSAAQPLA